MNIRATEHNNNKVTEKYRSTSKDVKIVFKKEVIDHIYDMIMDRCKNSINVGCHSCMFYEANNPEGHDPRANLNFCGVDKYVQEKVRKMWYQKDGIQ